MANLLTAIRVLLAFFTLGLLYTKSPCLYISAILLTLIVIILDGVDGYVARKLNEESKLGSLIDILGDRIVENAYWIIFAVLSWVPAWIPVLILTRGMITDNIRSIAFAEGYTAFGSSTMMQNPIYKFLTASRFMRAAYGFAKVAAFVTVIFAHIPNMFNFNPMTITQFAWFEFNRPLFVIIADFFVYTTVILCVVRGIPVVLESKRFFVKNDEQ